MTRDGAPVRVMLRPLGTPLPLGFLGLAVATSAFAVVQIGWLGADQERLAALAALAFAAPVQALTSVLGFFARDPVAGTGMGLLAGTWAVLGLATLTSAPGSAGPGLGAVLLAAAVCLVVPTVAGWGKLAAAAVMGVAAVRFAATGLAEITGAGGWRAAAGWLGLGLAVLALYAAAAFELEAVWPRAVLPLGRGRRAVPRGCGELSADVTQEPGVRAEL